MEVILCFFVMMIFEVIFSLHEHISFQMLSLSSTFSSSRYDGFDILCLIFI